MPEPISVTTAAFLGCALLAPRHSTGLSDEAETICGVRSAIVRHVEQSQSLFGQKSSLISQAWEIFNESQSPGRKADGESPVKTVALKEAIDFIRACPDGTTLPEIAADPDGGVCFEWISSRHRMLSLSLDGSGRIAFAWLDGTDKGHGVARFYAGQIPRLILEAINSITDAGHVGNRIA